MTRLVLDIEPKPQTRPRFTRQGRTYEDPKMKKWRKEVTGFIQKYYDGPFYSEAIAVEVVFYMKAPQVIARKPTPKATPKTWEKYKRFLNEKIPHKAKKDLDNLEKALYDSISDAGIVWEDDCLIVEHTTKKLYSPNPRIEIRIKDYDEN